MQSDTELYTIERFSTAEVLNGALDLNLLLSDTINGFVVTDFLDGSEISEIVNGFRDLHEEKLIKINPRFNTYPISFAQFAQMVKQNTLSEKDYFENSSDFISGFNSKFGIDIFGKLASLFSKIKNAPQFEIPREMKSGGNYIPFTFRELFAGGGCLKAHCENLFFHEFPDFFNRLSTFTIPDNQLSFFIVLQEPGTGGELTLYDILWNEKQKRPTDHEIILEDGQQLAFDDTEHLKRMSIPAKAGSLVVFSGGKIWHRVETVEEAPSRITLGGFLSFSHDRKKLFAWS